MKSWEFCLPWILTMVEDQDLKTPKKWIETKTKKLSFDLEQKRKFPRFEISILPCTQNWKVGNLRKFCFI